MFITAMKCQSPLSVPCTHSVPAEVNVMNLWKREITLSFHSGNKLDIINFLKLARIFLLGLCSWLHVKMEILISGSFNICSPLFFYLTCSSTILIPLYRVVPKLLDLREKFWILHLYMLCSLLGSGVLSHENFTLFWFHTSRCAGYMDMETSTNPIDRSIAQLLFHRSSDPSSMSDNGALSFQSLAMVILL